MLDDIGDGKPLNSEDEDLSIIPTSVTSPRFTTGFKEILSSFIGKLVKHGVPHEKINHALSEMPAEINRVSSAANKDLSAAVSNYLYKKELEKNRVDFLGRALLSEIEQYFPRNQKTAERLMVEPMAGHIPIQVAEGLIFALKKTHGVDVIEEYEIVCSRKAELYRNKDDMLIDSQKFLADPEIKGITHEILTRFRLLMHKKTEAEQKKWLLNQISSSPAFQDMKRDVSDDELGIITRAFLKKG
jgi:hypothetical protein